MQQYRLLLSIIALMATACTKETADISEPSQETSIAHATVVASGPMIYSSKTSGGSVAIYRQPNSKHLLKLEGVHLAAEHGLVIYLSPEKTLGAGSVKICSVAQLDGTALYELLTGFDFSLLKYLVIQTEPWEETVATATLA
ncbi:hypothetical protein [Paracnuella aquatica]|uniref:hypothetical protein n=1 Tax=Paracnuella aquatica TaxID=2268757 RepID=UPI000F4F43BB|nr:hypothetical protein [Paracnuella aquatica]RPD49188.1 hypothetical protein DRJ53_08725 [Paracnuella aquatica]